MPIKDSMASRWPTVPSLASDMALPEELIKAWIKVKETLEIAPLQKRPHPYEYDLYYDL